MGTMNISLPDEMKTFVERQVATGQFANSSDYIRDLIRERQVAVDRLRALIAEGEASSPSSRSVDEILADIKERYASRAA